MNRKTFLVALMLGASWLSSHADEPWKMRITFKEDANQSSPLTLEREHFITPLRLPTPSRMASITLLSA